MSTATHWSYSVSLVVLCACSCAALTAQSGATFTALCGGRGVRHAGLERGVFVSAVMVATRVPLSRNSGYGDSSDCKAYAQREVILTTVESLLRVQVVAAMPSTCNPLTRRA